MTEAEWFTCNDPAAMLAGVPAKVSDRKVRLFACAWARSECGWWAGPIRHRNPGQLERALRLVGKVVSAPVDAALSAGEKLLNRPNRQTPDAWIAAADAVMAAARKAMEVAERFADDLATDQERSAAYQPAMAEADGWGSYDLGVWLYASIGCAAAAPLKSIPAIVFTLNPYQGGSLGQRLFARDRAKQARLLREILGNPFRPVEIRETWLQADGGAVPKLAQAIYNDHRFCDLGQLARALQNAGCDHLDLIKHCQSRGPHFRGCWALDAILGRIWAD